MRFKFLHLKFRSFSHYVFLLQLLYDNFIHNTILRNYQEHKTPKIYIVAKILIIFHYFRHSVDYDFIENS